MKYQLAAACILAAFIQAPHALAETSTVTYFGVVNNTQELNGHTEAAPDYDVAQLFGGGNLEGDFLTATYVYNTSGGIPTQTSGSQELDGGLAFSASDPIVSVSLSIEQPVSLNVYTYTYAPDYYEDVYTSASGLSETAYSTTGDQSSTFITTDTAAPTNFYTSYVGTGYGPGSYFDPGLTNTTQLDSIVFDTVSVTVSAAPEPSTWVLMISGVGLVGGGLRLGHRRRGWATTAA